MTAGTLLSLVVSVLTDTVSTVSVFFRIFGSISLMCFMWFLACVPACPGGMFLRANVRL